jgi:hypothetical protein
MLPSWLRLRFGLKSLLVAIALCAVVAAVVSDRWRQATRQNRFVAEVAALRGAVRYDDGWNSDEIVASAINTDGHCLCVRSIEMASSDDLWRRDFQHSVVTVEIVGHWPDYRERLQSIVNQLPEYPTIESLALRGAYVSELDFSNVWRMRRLREVRVDQALVDDALLASLAQLPKLESLTVVVESGAPLSDEASELGLTARLSRALPEAKVSLVSH